MTPDTSVLLRPSAASLRFGVSTRTLARWAADGLIGKARRGGMTFYVASDIGDVIAAPLVSRRVIPMPMSDPALVTTSNEWRNHPIWAGMPAGRGRSARKTAPSR